MLRLLGDNSLRSVFTADQLHAQALPGVTAFNDLWMLALGLFGLHLLLIGYLAYRSGAVPRFLGVLIAVAGLGYLIDTFGVDIGGNRRLAHLRRALTRRGRLVIVGGEADGRWLGGTDRQLRAMLLSPFVSQELGTFVSSENAEDLMVVRELIESGEVHPVIDSIHPLRNVATAIRHLVEGRPRSKIVITVLEPGRG